MSSPSPPADRLSPYVAQALRAVTSQSQRWRHQRVRYRPPGQTFDSRRAEVVLLDDCDARQFICNHHYSQSYPAARLRVGLMVKPAFGRDYLGGVAVFSVPMSQAVIPAVLGVAPEHGIELGRLVLLDTPELTTNAESWFIARAHRQLRHRLPILRGVVAYCDPLERRDALGQLVKRSHTGVVYRASGCEFAGVGAGRTLWLTPDGQVASERALSKLRSQDQGRDYAERMLRDRGAPPRAPGEPAQGWLSRLKRDRFLSPLRHPGNLRFVWRWPP